MRREFALTAWIPLAELKEAAERWQLAAARATALLAGATEAECSICLAALDGASEPLMLLPCGAKQAAAAATPHVNHVFHADWVVYASRAA